MVETKLEDRSDAWLDLLSRLTELCSECGADGDVAEGFSGIGDIDLIAPTSAWALIEREFISWASARSLDPVIVCPHRPGVLILLATGGPGGSNLYELEVRAIRYLRGHLLFRAEDLVPMMQSDPRGFRKLRSGAGGLLRLIPSGTRWNGGLKWRKDRLATIIDRMKQDPEGVAEASKLFGSAQGPAIAGAERAVEGGWSRRAMVTVGVWALLKGIMRPVSFLRRLLARGFEGRCLVLKTITQQGKMAPADLESWLEAVREDHKVYVGR
jgi:hypothetical protein